MLQEKVGMVDIIGSIIIMCGIVMVVAFGAHGHFELDHESLKGYLFKQSMFIYAVVFFFCAAVCVTATWVSDAERILKYAKDPVRTTRSPVMRNSSSSHHMQPIDSLDSPANTADNQRSTKHKFLSYLARPQVGLFCCSAASGLFGGNTNVFAKAAIEVVSKESFGGFQHPVVVFVAILTISCALMQLYFLNESLKRYEAVYCVPIINAALVAVAAIASNILFDDWKQISTSDMCFFCVGALLVVGGILSLYFTDRREGENVNAPTIAELDDEEALFADTFDDNDFIVQNTMESKNGSKRLIDDQERTKLIERGYLATQTKFGGDQELKFMGTGTGNNSGSNGGTPNKKKNLSNSSPGEFIFGDNFDGIAQPTSKKTSRITSQHVILGSAMSRVSTPEQSPRQHKNDMEDDDDDLFGTRAKQQQQKQPSLLL